jgi:hypothetical protein
MRGFAALAAVMLVASNALAATGLCLVKAPLRAPVTADAAAAPCPYHQAETQADTRADASADVPVPTAAHCPQDDPGVQVRGGDNAAADLAPAAPLLVAALPVMVPLRRIVATVDHSPPTPLYTRLGRLRL